MTRAPGDPDEVWCVADRGAGMLVGPHRALGSHPNVRGRVGLTSPVADLGPVVAEFTVAESGVREFVVPWHVLPGGRMVAANPAGGNQVSWQPGGDTEFGVTPAPDGHLTSVYVRFVLRHVTTALLEQDLHGRSVHAVTAGRAGGGLLAVCGPTRAGKTRLMNHLIAAGLAGDVIDDDCPVLTPDGLLATLVPRRYEVARASCLPLRALVLLSDRATDVHLLDPGSAHRFLERAPMPWPVPWLPGPHRPGLPDVPADVVVVAAPTQDEGAFAAVAALLSAGR
ncbi:MAG: hypothetical protein ABI808_05810 [Pseudonocardiales bacterium]